MYIFISSVCHFEITFECALYIKNFKGNSADGWQRSSWWLLQQHTAGGHHSPKLFATCHISKKKKIIIEHTHTHILFWPDGSVLGRSSSFHSTYCWHIQCSQLTVRWSTFQNKMDVYCTLVNITTDYQTITNIVQQRLSLCYYHYCCEFMPVSVCARICKCM